VRTLFLCQDCHAKEEKRGCPLGWELHAKSYGKCEDCGKTAVCVDCIAHKFLPRGKRSWEWVRDYADISPCIELSALADDALKRDKTFTSYAVKLAQEIALRHKLSCKVTWGKWGARLETGENPKLTEKTLEEYATTITNDEHWIGLRKSAEIFSK
jgi:hypothetical protein